MPKTLIMMVITNRLHNFPRPTSLFAINAWQSCFSGQQVGFLEYAMLKRNIWTKFESKTKQKKTETHFKNPKWYRCLVSIVTLWNKNYHLPKANLFRKVCHMYLYFSAIERMFLGASSCEAFIIWRFEENLETTTPFEGSLVPNDWCWQ